MEANTGIDHSKITMLVPDMDGAHRRENIIMNVVRAHGVGDFEYTKGVIANSIMARAIEGDATVDILTYLPTG